MAQLLLYNCLTMKWFRDPHLLCFYQINYSHFRLMMDLLFFFVHLIFMDDEYTSEFQHSLLANL